MIIIDVHTPSTTHADYRKACNTTLSPQLINNIMRALLREGNSCLFKWTKRIIITTHCSFTSMYAAVRSNPSFPYDNVSTAEWAAIFQEHPYPKNGQDKLLHLLHKNSFILGDLPASRLLMDKYEDTIPHLVW